MRRLISILLLLVSSVSVAAIPATPVMTVYQFNGKVDVPFYAVEAFLTSRKPKAAGTLAQGSAVIPCLVLRNDRPVTNRKGTPYVGFSVVLDAADAGPASAREFSDKVAERASMWVENHHCPPGPRHVIDVRKLVAKKSPPLFEPQATGAATPRANQPNRQPNGERDAIVRAFHNSAQCAGVNREVTGRRGRLERAWDQFTRAQRGRWPGAALKQARHLDYTLRTALFEGHLGRGCNAYGACERNVIALSIRNRARGSCAKYQGCRGPGDFQGVASKPSQYNIWDEYLTQISGITGCYLRDDLGSGGELERGAYYDKLQALYAQNQPDVERILFGDDADLRGVFPDTALAELKQLRHYYHAPAMGKCFPGHPRVEYMSGAVARKGGDFALIANTRIQVDKPTNGGYFFRLFDVTLKDERDEIALIDSFNGFVVDGRKVELRATSRCRPYGIPKGCRQQNSQRHRRTPPWLTAGRPLALTCRIRDRGEQCQGSASLRAVEVGGRCDREMRPVARVR